MYQTILVPFDGSPLSARALPVAAELARRARATLHLVTVHDPSAYIPFVPGEVAIPIYDADMVSVRREQDQAALDDAVAALRRDGVEATGTLIEGTIVEALAERAQSIGASLTVMTTHGRSGFERLRLGSVTTAYLTRATNPVLIVRGAGSAETPVLPSGALLCPLDGSPFAERILPHARTFAELIGMSLALTAISVPRAIPMAPFGAEALLADDDSLRDEEEGREQYLARIAQSCPPGTTVNAVTDMTVAPAIVTEALRASAGAIAMATHGRGGFKRLLLGSVADEVLRHSSLPMLLYRPESK